MTSKLAQSTYEQWLNEGLKPSFSDIVDLNTVGVALERNGNSSAFYNAPRIAFLGDLLLHEPSIEKRLYMDEAKQIISNESNSWLYMISYVLNTDYSELPKLDNARKLVREIKRFTEDNLMQFTYNQILCAVDYALNGYSEDELNGDYEDVKETKDAVELPESCVSMAQMLLNKALGYRLDSEGCKTLTVPQLERVIAIAAMQNGADIMKDENIELTGRFYTVAGKIKARLLKEKKDKDNG